MNTNQTILNVLEALRASAIDPDVIRLLSDAHTGISKLETDPPQFPVLSSPVLPTPFSPESCGYLPIPTNLAQVATAQAVDTWLRGYIAQEGLRALDPVILDTALGKHFRRRGVHVEEFVKRWLRHTGYAH